MWRWNDNMIKYDVNISGMTHAHVMKPGASCLWRNRFLCRFRRSVWGRCLPVFGMGSFTGSRRRDITGGAGKGTTRGALGSCAAGGGTAFTWASATGNLGNGRTGIICRGGGVIGPLACLVGRNPRRFGIIATLWASWGELASLPRVSLASECDGLTFAFLVWPLRMVGDILFIVCIWRPFSNGNWRKGNWRFGWLCCGPWMGCLRTVFRRGSRNSARASDGQATQWWWWINDEMKWWNGAYISLMMRSIMVSMYYYERYQIDLLI